MDPNDKAIEEAIASSLRNYEEPYEEGNWEIFNEKYKEENKKRGIFYLITAGRKRYIIPAAALMLILLKLTLFDHQQLPNDKPTVHNNNKLHIEKGHGTEPMKNQPDDRREAYLQNTKRLTVHDEGATDEQLNRFESKALDQPEEDKVVAAASNDINRTPGKTSDKLIAQTESLPPNREYLSRNSRIKDPFRTSVEKENDPAKPPGRWAFGVELSSSFTSKKMSYGGGLATQFKVSENFSLGTGVMFANLNAANPVSDGRFSSDPRRVGVETNLQAIDIPLNIIYRTKKGLYASVGLSALSVISEDKAFVYETERVEHRFVLDPNSGVGSTQSFLVKENYTESTKEKDFKGRSNLLFFNLSVGKIQNIGGNNNISIEPFLKVPMGKLSNEEVKLTNAGVRLKFLF